MFKGHIREVFSCFSRGSNSERRSRFTATSELQKVTRESLLVARIISECILVIRNFERSQNVWLNMYKKKTNPKSNKILVLNCPLQKQRLNV